MSWINIKNLAYLIILSTHFIILSQSYLTSPGSKGVVLASMITGLLIIPIVANVAFDNMKTLAVNSSLILVFLLIMEGLFAFRIIQHPVISTWTVTSSKNIDAVDFLGTAPFLKFKPNFNVRSQGSRGDDFTYEWQTDALGFKNPAHTEILTLHFDFIALGDSFTEGMGVAIDNTWTSKVNQKSTLTIYNAGVQGYSASQMKATYENLMEKISHEGIIIGALPQIFGREQTFSKYETATLGTGGIRSIAESEYSRNSFLTGLVRAIYTFVKSKIVTLSDGNIASNKYSSEIPISYSTRAALRQNANWKKYVENLIDLSNLALHKDKKVILIQYPYRYEIYFNTQQLGLKELEEINYYVELDLLREALPKNVEILDMFPYIKEDWIANKSKIYFNHDGHMNERGQDLISDFVITKVGKY